MEHTVVSLVWGDRQGCGFRSAILGSWIRICIRVKSWIRIRTKVKIQELSRLTMHWRVCRPLAVDLYHFDEDPDLHLSEKSDPDLDQH